MQASASNTITPAMAAASRCTSYAQNQSGQASRKSDAQMWAAAGAAASIFLYQTGVSASVSLFVLLIALGNLLLVTLIGVLSLQGLLSLRGLTGLLKNLVGLIQGLAPGATMGD
jgi:hypothetical protein